jgi:hypothetical protein
MREGQCRNPLPWGIDSNRFLFPSGGRVYPRSIMSSDIYSSSDIYTEAIATLVAAGHQKRVIVLVPGRNIDKYKTETKDDLDELSIAKELAEDLVRHALAGAIPSYERYTLEYFHYLTPPPSLEGHAPNFPMIAG